ncbi:MAG: enoyl-CoA hydratase family protein [Halopseudomonas yangmingensis]|uniref:Enoyl-CoA hydratase/carnithine racemase n=1 Tax=Halopseudomonas yangmingensis TaxID=1720063 RepID=A0A1I4PUI3_9GAMM|nr:enoyl-CoA hydratase family protein [Halopseudomonas yangmingensis]SFM31458.1 Enoyl-CoA hydratase/carnithine racemase [Halopseudomonas yangmingensis]
MSQPCSQDDIVLCQRSGATCILTLNRPQRRNALETATYQLMNRYLDEALDDPTVANLVLRGAGDFFCSGGDLLALETRAALAVEERAALIEHLHTLVRRLRSSPKPVIAAIEGGAAGAGASLAFACDLVVAARDSYVSLAYVKAGLVPDGGGSAFLALSLPHQLAAEIALFGERLPIERLAAAGVVNRLVEPGQALTVALQLGEQLAGGARQSQTAILELLDSAQREVFERQLDRERDLMAVALGSAEAAEGIAAFKGKRAPDFARLY